MRVRLTGSAVATSILESAASAAAEIATELVGAHFAEAVVTSIAAGAVSTDSKVTISISSIRSPVRLAAIKLRSATSHLGKSHQENWLE